MNLSDRYKCLSVKIAHRDGNWGSGSLFQPISGNFTYIFTAKHCLMDQLGNPYPQEDIVITRGTGEPLSILDTYLHPELDLALITINRVEALPSVSVDSPSEKVKSYSIYGYPTATAAPKHVPETKFSTSEAHRFEVSLNLIEGNEIRLTSSVPLSTYTVDESGNVKGLSGAGVYHESGDNLVLVGVFTQFPGQGGAFSSLSGYTLEGIEELVHTNGLIPIIPHHLSDFSLYIDDTFSHHEKNIERVLHRFARQICSVKPHEIVRLFGEKLFLPHSVQDTQSPELWQGWLALLTYLFLESGTCQVTQDMKRVSNNGYSHRVRFYYSHTYKKLHDIIRYLLLELNDEIAANDRVIVNHSGRAGKLFFGSENIKQIVKDIGQAEFYDRDIFDIAQADVSKNMTCMHIEYFTQEFCLHDEVDDMLELENRLRSSISGVLDNAG